MAGGVRREAQLTTVVKNTGKAQEFAAVSASAQGDAYEALGVQLETIQTSLTRLGNAFVVLARTMGSEGGALSLMGNLLKIVEGLVKGVTALTKGLGDMTPYLAALGLVLVATSQQTRGAALSKVAIGGGNLIDRVLGG